MKPFAAAIVFATVVFTTAALAQPLQFEVASIRLSAPFQPENVALGLRMDGQQAHIVAFSLRDYIAMAYKIRLGQISGPDWLPDTRFDINATLPQGAKTDQIPDMLQGLLADRFQLKFHREKKDFDVYVLTRTNRPLALTPVTAEAPPSDGSVNVAAAGSGAGVSVNLGNGSSYAFTNNKFEGKRLSTLAMVNQLERYMDRPMVDQSGLSGVYDMSLDITADDYRVMLIRGAKASGIVLPPQAQRLADGATTPSLFEAIEKLGLRLEAKKIPLDVIVVDQISKAPSEN